MSKLLSDDELRKEIANILLLDRQAMEPYVSVVDDLINLINTQKRLYAEMVVGKCESDNGYDKIIERMIKDEQIARIKQMTKLTTRGVIK